MGGRGQFRNLPVTSLQNGEGKLIRTCVTPILWIGN